MLNRFGLITQIEEAGVGEIAAEVSVRFPSLTRRPESGKGSGFRSMALTTLKIIVFAPIPRASVTTATAVNPGFLINSRTP